eukprot:g21944.t1
MERGKNTPSTSAPALCTLYPLKLQLEMIAFRRITKRLPTREVEIRVGSASCCSQLHTLTVPCHLRWQFRAVLNPPRCPSLSTPCFSSSHATPLATEDSAQPFTAPDFDLLSPLKRNYPDDRVPWRLRSLSGEEFVSALLVQLQHAGLVQRQISSSDSKLSTSLDNPLRRLKREHWLEVMNMYAAKGEAAKCEEVLKKMRSLGIELDFNCWAAVLRAYFERKDSFSTLLTLERMAQARELELEKLPSYKQEEERSMMKPEVLPKNVVVPLLGVYVRSGDPHGAVKAIERMQRLNYHVTAGHYNSLMRGFIEMENWPAVMTVHRGLEVSGYKPTHRTFNILMNVFAQLGDLETATAVLKDMQAAKLAPNYETAAILIKAAFRKGEPSRAKDFFAAMRQGKHMYESGKYPGIKVFPYIAMIQGYVNTSPPRIDKARSVLEVLRADSIPPDNQPYIILLGALYKRAANKTLLLQERQEAVAEANELHLRAMQQGVLTQDLCENRLHFLSLEDVHPSPQKVLAEALHFYSDVYRTQLGLQPTKRALQPLLRIIERAIPMHPESGKGEATNPWIGKGIVNKEPDTHSEGKLESMQLLNWLLAESRKAHISLSEHFGYVFLRAGFRCSANGLVTALEQNVMPLTPRLAYLAVINCLSPLRFVGGTRDMVRLQLLLRQPASAQQQESALRVLSLWHNQVVSLARLDAQALQQRVAQLRSSPGAKMSQVSLPSIRAQLYKPELLSPMAAYEVCLQHAAFALHHKPGLSPEEGVPGPLAQATQVLAWLREFASASGQKENLLLLAGSDRTDPDRAGPAPPQPQSSLSPPQPQSSLSLPERALLLHLAFYHALARLGVEENLSEMADAIQVLAAELRLSLRYQARLQDFFTLNI